MSERRYERRLLSAGRERSGQPRYRSWNSVRQVLGPDEVIELVEAVGLAGKGGAGFPTHRKLRLMRTQPGTRKILVLNGAEHEPGSLKDRHLLENHPHLVLEGALILAHAVGAGEVIVAINQAAPGAMRAFAAAVSSAVAAGVDFAGIEVRTAEVPDHYIVGEETALLEVIEGRAALPRSRPPYPIEQGIQGAPTLVQNVETAAHLPFIVSHGVVPTRESGGAGGGVTLCTLGEEFANSGVYEVPLGMPLREILEGLGGGLRDGAAIKAVQPGGPSSGFLASSALDVGFDAVSLRRQGSALGCAAIRAYSVDSCMVEEIARIMRFFAQESCGQCPRCRMETGMLDAILRKVVTGGGSWQLLAQVDKLIDLAKGQGKCTLIDMPVAPLKSGLALFRDEFQAHIEGACGLCAAHGQANLTALQE
ncbi:MAG TPA: NADH-ubiquinone oxidoreductase-F iron-sulfur binding region domain-containing protein [Steroidobacteraceae bacterium]|nr:NADH-ubiquinone oxidoreductase-F iron-sulfur binding region domain-containing protein [Steroidobacteraceae bacterium]